MSSSGSAPRGFTLIELVVVVTILGIVVAIAIPSYLSFRGGLSQSTCSKVDQGSQLRASQLPVKLTSQDSWVYRDAAGHSGRTYAVVDFSQYLAIRAYDGQQAFLLNGPNSPNKYAVYQVGKKGCDYKPPKGFPGNLPQQFIVFAPGTHTPIPDDWGSLVVAGLK